MGFNSLCPHLFFAFCRSIKRTKGKRFLRSCWQKNKSRSGLADHSDSEFYVFFLDLARFWRKNAQKHEKNELLSGRQKFVFLWRSVSNVNRIIYFPHLKINPLNGCCISLFLCRFYVYFSLINLLIIIRVVDSFHKDFAVICIIG